MNYSYPNRCSLENIMDVKLFELFFESVLSFLPCSLLYTHDVHWMHRVTWTVHVAVHWTEDCNKPRMVVKGRTAHRRHGKKLFNNKTGSENTPSYSLSLFSCPKFWRAIQGTRLPDRLQLQHANTCGSLPACTLPIFTHSCCLYLLRAKMQRLFLPVLVHLSSLKYSN